MTHNSENTYKPALLSGMVTFLVLALPGIYGCGCGHSSILKSAYVSQELTGTANPVYQVTFNSGSTNCTAAAVVIPALAGKQVRSIKAATVKFPDNSTELRLYALVTSGMPNGNFLMVIRESDKSVIAAIPVQSQAQALAISPESQKAYVVRTTGNQVYRIDLAANTLEATVSPLNGLGQPVLQQATDIAVRRTNLGQDQLWIGDAGSNGVAVLDHTQAFVARVALQPGAGAVKIAFSPDHTVLFTTTTNPFTSVWAVDAAGTDAGVAPSIVASAGGISNAEAIGPVTGKRVRVITATIVQFEEVEFDFSQVNPGSTRTTIRSFPNRPAALLHDYDLGGTFVAERNDNRVACPTSGVTVGVVSSPVSLTQPRTMNVPAPVAPVSITVTTNPVGRTFEVDAVTYTSPQVFSWIPGTSHHLNAVTPQTTFNFTNWSDSNTSPSRPFITPSSAGSITANYTASSVLVSYNIQGVFNCVNSATLSGCGTSTIIDGGFRIAYTGHSETLPPVPPVVSGNFGTITVTCQDGTNTCAPQPATAATLSLQVNQTAPSPGIGVIPQATFSGMMGPSAGVYRLQWGSGLSTSIPWTGGNILYTLDTPPLGMLIQFTGPNLIQGLINTQ